ncbi:hypothetical protein F5Y04DRAFT_287919 [Hypomontagnella monticulosa]|nr:hypothetical protein F5Y04DRAFT_287919 [Hypomontagnella monticulosa]
MASSARGRRFAGKSTRNRKCARNTAKTDTNIKGLRPSGRPITKPSGSWKPLCVARHPHIHKTRLAEFARRRANYPPSRMILEHLQRKDHPQVLFVANAHLDAIDFATHIIDPTIPVSRLVVFCDGSVARANGGFGIAYKLMQDPGRSVDWVDAIYGVHFDCATSSLMEIVAIHRTLWITHDVVTRLADAKIPSLPKIVILSDCLPAINYFNGLYSRTLPTPRGIAGTLAANALEPLKRLERLGCKIEIHWVPGHIGVARNERVDALAAIGRVFASLVPRVTGPEFKNTILPLSVTEKFRSIEPIDIGKPGIEVDHWATAEMHDITGDLLRIMRTEVMSIVEPIINCFACGDSFVKDVAYFERHREWWPWLSVASLRAIRLSQQLLEDTRPKKRKVMDSESDAVENLQPVAKKARTTTQPVVEDATQDVADEEERIADEIIETIYRRVADMIADKKALFVGEHASPTSKPALEPD